MKTLILFTIPLLWSFVSPAQSGPQSMVKLQPFPFGVGVAMDTTLFKSIKAKLVAGELLQASARKAVDSLKKEIRATQQVLLDQKALTDYHVSQNEQLRQDNTQLQTELDTVKGDLKSTSEAVMTMYEELPAHIQRPIGPLEPKTITQATTAYVKVLRSRKWKWAGWSVLGGTLLGIFGTVYVALH